MPDDSVLEKIWLRLLWLPVDLTPLSVIRRLNSSLGFVFSFKYTRVDFGFFFLLYILMCCLEVF